jgi:hypothetical protein
MKASARRKHLHASVIAAGCHGIALGWWIGARSGEAGVIESAIVGLGMFVVFVAIMSRIDKRFDYTDGGDDDSGNDPRSRLTD